MCSKIKSETTKMIKPTLPSNTSFEVLQKTQKFNIECSLNLLDIFYQEVRKELERNDFTTVTALKDRETVAIPFIGEGFNLSLEYPEGGMS